MYNKARERGGSFPLRNAINLYEQPQFLDVAVNHVGNNLHRRRTLPVLMKWTKNNAVFQSCEIC